MVDTQVIVRENNIKAFKRKCILNNIDIFEIKEIGKYFKCNIYCELYKLKKISNYLPKGE